jgi:hypothetical protein
VDRSPFKGDVVAACGSLLWDIEVIFELSSPLFENQVTMSDDEHVVAAA